VVTQALALGAFFICEARGNCGRVEKGLIVVRDCRFLIAEKEMNRFRWLLVIAGAFAIVTGVPGGVLFPAHQVRAAGGQTGSDSAQSSSSDQGLRIQGDSEMPEGYLRRDYDYRFTARGAFNSLHWKVEKGALPTGLSLEDNGLLHGKPVRAGEFQFTVSVFETGRRESTVQKEFVLRVVAALALRWNVPAHVNANRIEGSVTVTNTTPDDIDLTFIVMAVPSDGRAVAIGYQHFVLPRDTTAMDLPFGDTLPHGGYVVHVDAIGEVEARNLIYRERMQTPGPLQVTVGP
jgi:Putative Ig domain